MVKIFVDDVEVDELWISTKGAVEPPPVDPPPVDPPPVDPPPANGVNLGVVSNGYREFHVSFNGTGRIFGIIEVPVSNKVRHMTVGVQPEFSGCVVSVVHPDGTVVWQNNILNGGQVSKQFLNKEYGGSAIVLEQGVNYTLNIFNRGDDQNARVHLISVGSWST